jgi:hypothetical protein
MKYAKNAKNVVYFDHGPIVNVQFSHLTLACRNLADSSNYVIINNQ